MSKISKEKKRLNNIVYHIKHAHSYLIKFFWYVFGFYYGGALLGKYQKFFAKKINIMPKTLTIVNSVIFGFGGAILYFLFGPDAIGFFSSLLLSEIQHIFKLTFIGVATTYTYYVVLMNSVRIIYSEFTKKPLVSISLMGLMMSVIHFLAVFVHRDILKKKHEFHG